MYEYICKDAHFGCYIYYTKLLLNNMVSVHCSTSVPK